MKCFDYDKEIKRVIKKIYSIDCKKNECKSCKGGLDWCPKSYADEITRGLRLISSNLNVCENIIKEHQL